VASPEVRVSKKCDSSACQREIGRGNIWDPTLCSSAVARTVEGSSWRHQREVDEKPMFGL
jgi:hypothetical protein